MTTNVSDTADSDDIYEHVGGGTSCPPTDFERWITSA